ncbi:hypothetical protein [Paenibacillus sedimenti]|uniref:Uncharacterized protein n=1 Tax=Paenibacillus sedimenti TaxID=2770274 RepID=A0A926QHT9_9BACL|nr:hypothetical protein [Paenibacillus sedimenti]MBD0378879.1 hypothetical protein [Paenibacillus sedimenti]
MVFIEGKFDLNDYFLISCIIVAYGVIYFMPRRFSVSISLLLLIFGSTVASMLDNSIGGGIFDLYDIMDGPAYSVMDLVAYLLYAPFGYLLIYFYDLFQIKGMKTIGYIALCSLISVIFEWICVQAGVFTYKNSYMIYYSFCIYLFTQSCTILFYRFIAEKRTFISEKENDR